ncbi:MAG: UDP-glucose--hexose-1-phosphate uridylyltransferase [Candidatus Dormibacteraeota bacterium]|nr:UDP-glucose--hexose-1-phosphate uridylyltransferase [Candidatus Dormibacteraeota bacterium]
MFDPASNPHRRYNPLSREWVLVSPHRTLRPWQGQVDPPGQKQLPAYDPACYLCPRNERAGGKRNPEYEQTFVFTNDFAALLPDGPRVVDDSDPLLHVQSERGTCRVVCFSPRHDQTLGELDQEGLTRVVDVWTEQYVELGGDPLINHVQIFENRGAMMGASNPHPHGQIWATEHVPLHVAREQECQAHHYATHSRSLLADYLSRELALEERLVCVNEHFAVVVPFWAVWPFETLVISRRHVGSLTELEGAERASLADIVKRLVTRYDNLFEAFFPYSMGFHQTPTDGQAHPEWHLHLHFYPPLLRSASVRKFMVGFELLAEPQRDISPEQAAQRLRSLEERHYRLLPRANGGPNERPRH